MTTANRDVRAYREFLGVQLGVPALLPYLTRLFAAGEPVTVEQVAAVAGLPADQVRTELEGLERDDAGRVVGWGSEAHPTPHTFSFEGGMLYATCASHALNMPVILGRPGVVESACPVTSRRIRIDVTPGEVRGVDPPQAVVSKIRPTSKVDDVRAEICALGSFFAAPEAASGWLAGHPQAMVVPVVGEFAIIRQTMIELGWAA